jgi:hypothetical protein
MRNGALTSTESVWSVSKVERGMCADSSSAVSSSSRLGDCGDLDVDGVESCDACESKRDCIEKSISRFPGRPVLCRDRAFSTLAPGRSAPNETPLMSPVEFWEASSIVFTEVNTRGQYPVPIRN